MATTTTNMGLLKAVGTDNARDYLKTDLAGSLDDVDAHDHSTGKGVQIPTGGIADDAVTADKLAANAVATAAIQDSAVTAAKLDAAVAGNLVTNGNSHDHAGGDGAQIPTAGIADDAVDDTKVGNRVARLVARQGGDTNVWVTPGTTNRAVTTVVMQAGSISITVPDGSISASAYITFPQGYSYMPLVFVTAEVASGQDLIHPIAAVGDQSTDACYIWLTRPNPQSTGGDITRKVYWLAIGPE